MSAVIRITNPHKHCWHENRTGEILVARLVSKGWAEVDPKETGEPVPCYASLDEYEILFYDCEAI